MNNRHYELFLENTQWSKDMLRFSKATEYKTEIGLTYPPEIKSSDSVCFEEKKKMLRFSFLPKINNYVTIYKS